MLVLGNGKVITRDPACPLIENGAVAVDGPCLPADRERRGGG